MSPQSRPQTPPNTRHEDTEQHAQRDRGLSEAIGYVLIFATVIVAVFTLASGIFGNFGTLTADAQTTGGEQSVHDIHTGITQVTSSGDYTVDISVPRGTLTQQQQETITVTGTNTTGVQETVNISTQPFVYQIAGSDTEIVYTAGFATKIQGSPDAPRQAAVLISHPGLQTVAANSSQTTAAVHIPTAVRTDSEQQQLTFSQSQQRGMTVSKDPTAIGRTPQTVQFNLTAGPITIDLTDSQVTSAWQVYAQYLDRTTPLTVTQTASELRITRPSGSNTIHTLHLTVTPLIADIN